MPRERLDCILAILRRVADVVLLRPDDAGEARLQRGNRLLRVVDERPRYINLVVLLRITCETAATVLKLGRVMSIFPEGGVHSDRVPAKSGVGHIAHLAGAVVLPVYLSGTRSLYRPWKRWPKVRVVIGAPLHIEESSQPSREQSRQTAQRVLDAIHDLAPQNDTGRTGS